MPSAEPEPEDDHEMSEDELEEAHIENADDETDFLGDFPDETDVRRYLDSTKRQLT